MTSKAEETTFTIVEVSSRIGIPPERIVALIEREWILPGGDAVLDHEDIARLKLIQELEDDLGANPESIPLILHLVDQVCFLREQLRRLGQSRS